MLEKRMIRVRIADIGQSLYEVTSFDLPGLYFVSADKASLIGRISAGIRAILEIEADVQSVETVETLVSDDAETVLFATAFTKREPTGKTRAQ